MYVFSRKKRETDIAFFPLFKNGGEESTNRYIVVLAMRYWLNLRRIVSLSHRWLSSDSTVGPLRKYRELISAGTIREDALQLKTLKSFERLYDQLLVYAPNSPVSKVSKKIKEDGGGLWGGFFPSKTAPDRKPPNSGAVSPKGLYIWGGVGCG